MNAMPNWKIAFCATVPVSVMCVILPETISAVNVMEILLAPDARMEFAPTVRATVMPTSFLSVFAATVKVSALAVMV